MYLRSVRGSVKERRLHGSGDIALHFAAGARLQILLDRIAGKKIRGPGVAIAAAGADRGSSSLYLDLQVVATSVDGNGRLVAEKVVLVLVLGDALQAAQQIIGVQNDKTAGAIGELIENLLIISSAGRKLRNDLPGLRVGIVEGI